MRDRTVEPVPRDQILGVNGGSEKKKSLQLTTRVGMSTILVVPYSAIRIDGHIISWNGRKQLRGVASIRFHSITTVITT